MDRNTTSVRQISVIIPVYEEVAAIGGVIDHLRATSGKTPVEIVVADGGPGHATLAAIDDAAVIKVESPPGRGVQMNAGAALAGGDILMFLHADTRLPDGWPEMVRAVLSGGVRAGGFSLAMDSDRFALNMIAFFANLRTRWERVPYGDQAHFLEAAFFHELDGYAPIPIMEDVELFLRIRQRGERIAVLKERVLTSPRRYEKDGAVRRVLSNWWLRIRFKFGTSPHVLAGDYRPQGEES